MIPIDKARPHIIPKPNVIRPPKTEKLKCKNSFIAVIVGT